jgi:hypothetical protein
MEDATLEERVATLEQLVAQLMRTSERTARKKDWRRMIGMFDGDPIITRDYCRRAAPPRRKSPTRAHMILLDTDHLSLLQARDAPTAFALQERDTAPMIQNRQGRVAVRPRCAPAVSACSPASCR